MPAAFPGNSTTKLARSDGAGGFESAIEGGAPVPSGINATGTVAHGSTLTITDSESRLGTKDQAAPRYWIFGDEVYVDGVPQTDLSSVTSESTVPDLPYLSQGSSPPIVSAARPYRHNRVARHFHGTSRTHTGQFTNLANEAIAEGVRNALYVSWWLRLGFNPQSARYDQIDSISTSPAPDFGSDSNDADGEQILIDGQPVGRLIGTTTVEGIDYVTFNRYDSRSFDGETVTGATTGATIVFTTGGAGGNFSGKSLRADPLNYPAVVSIGVNLDDAAEHFAQDETGSTIYDVRRVGTNFDAGDLAQDDTVYDDRANPFPRWGHHHHWLDFTGTYMRDRSGRDFKNLKYQSSYEHLITQSSPPVDQANGLIPTSRASADAPILFNVGYEPGGSTKGSGNVDFSEILVDRTPRRVVIGNAPTWDQVTHVEDQRTTAWAADSVSVVQNLGAFADGDDFWFYIMDDLDEPIFTNGIARTEVQ